MPPSDPLLNEVIAAYPFPDPESADASGLLAHGGDLCAGRLLSAYAQGIFPWYDSEPVLWFCPDPRMVLLPDELHVSRSLARTLRRDHFRVSFDVAFDRVIAACASIRRSGQDGTWITADMIDAYCGLYDLGFAHCVSVWQDDELAGGIYGVSLGTGFFGESMFSSRADASKVAMLHLVERLRAWSFRFLDCQVYNDHLASLGAREWPRRRFLDELERALEGETRRGSWSASQ